MMTRWILMNATLVVGLACSESDGTSGDSSLASTTGSPSSTGLGSSDVQGAAGSMTDPVPAQTQSLGTVPVSDPTGSGDQPTSSMTNEPAPEPSMTSFEPGPGQPSSGPSRGGSNSGGSQGALGGGGSGGAEPTNGGTSGESSAGSGGDSEPSTGCEDGPLDAPIDGCRPDFEESGDFYQDCVDRINQLRWECQCLPPLERWVEGEACADQHSEYDYNQDEAHAGIRNNICESGGSSQNECPGYSPNFDIVNFCLQQMWDEGPGEDFQAHGHYINMSSTSATKVACGLYVTPEGDLWSVQNFSR